MTNVINLAERREKKQNESWLNAAKTFKTLANSPTELDRIAQENFEKKCERIKESVKRINKLCEELRKGK